MNTCKCKPWPHIHDIYFSMTLSIAELSHLLLEDMFIELCDHKLGQVRYNGSRYTVGNKGTVSIDDGQVRWRVYMDTIDRLADHNLGEVRFERKDVFHAIY